MKIFISNYKVSLAILLTLLTLLSFNNCSDVDFSADADLVSKILSQNTSVVINDGDLFTNNNNVILTIQADNASEMMVSNHSSSETRWEPYKKIKSWNLTTLNTNAKVYVKFRAQGTESPGWISDDITHDNIKPMLNASSAPQGFVNTNFSSLKIDIIERGSGIKNNYCSLNFSDNAFSLCNGDNKLVINRNINHTNDGPFQFYAYAIDKAGNKSDTTSINWVVDRVAPTVDFTGQLLSLTSNKNSNINFTGSDTTSGISHYLCSWQNSKFNICSPPHIKSNLSDGSYELSIRSVDQAGNLSAIKTHNWEVHVAAPVITFVQPLPKTLSKDKNPLVGFIGRDKTFIMKSFTCRLDGGSYKSCSSPYATQTLNDGKHILRVKGKDRLGKLSVAFSYSWTVDTKINNPTFVKKPKKLSNDKNAHFQIGNVDADVKTLYCKFDQQAYKACPTKSAFTFSNLSSKAHSLSVYAVDKIGNQSKKISYSFTVDSIAPLISVSGPANNSLALDIDKFTITASDNLTSTNNLVYHCKIDSGAFKLCSNVFESALAPNIEHSFIAKVTDQAGNSTVSSPYIYKTLTLKLSASFTKKPETVNTKEDLIKFMFSVDNGNYPIKSSTCKLSGSNNFNRSVSCQPNQLLNLGKLAVNSYVFTVNVKNNFGSSINISYDFKVQKIGECSGGQVCLVIKDDFERTDIRSGEFGWSSFLIDSSSSQGLDISTKTLGQASSGNSAAFFTGRKGGSVHGLFLNSQEINLTGYSSLSIEFDYIMASFESWTYGNTNGLEHFKVDICTLGEYECGVKKGSTNVNKIKDGNRWKTLYERNATTPINQHLNGNNHVLADYTRIKDNQLTVNLNNSSLVSNKAKVILRWSFKMDEGIIDENGSKNYVDGATPDAGILDNILVKAYKN